MREISQYFLIPFRSWGENNFQAATWSAESSCSSSFWGLLVGWQSSKTGNCGLTPPMDGVKKRGERGRIIFRKRLLLIRNASCWPGTPGGAVTLKKQWSLRWRYICCSARLCSASLQLKPSYCQILVSPVNWKDTNTHVLCGPFDAKGAAAVFAQ